MFDLNKLSKLEKIRRGALCKVYKVFDKETNKIYCAKISLDKENDGRIDISRSYNLISNLNYPTILKYIGYSPVDFHNKNFKTIIIEYCSNGSLEDIMHIEKIRNSHPLWNFTKKVEILFGIAKGMSYLHSHDIIHRDLTPSNILLDDSLNPKISGFSLSISTHEKIKENVVGTPIYIAPEVMKSQEYTTKCDVYSFSMILFEILAGQKPFEHKNFHQLMFEVVLNGIRPILPDYISKPCQNLIERCWSEDPHERPTFDEIAEFLKNNPNLINNENLNLDEFIDYTETFNK